MLELTQSLSAGTVYRIDSAAGSVLRVDAAAAAGTNFTFAGSVGTLELSDVTSGTLRNFSGTVTGLAVGTSATVPTDDVNIQATVTKATLSGNQIVVVNGTTTVATLQLAAAPGAGAYTAIKADTTLGGYDVFLTNAPPSLTWSATAAAGTEGAPIALGALASSSANTLASVLLSGVPAGAVVTDGVHSTVAAGSPVNVLGWNYAALTVTPANDANFTLSAQANDVSGNASAVVTKLVTVNPLAPTVAAVTVSGTAGQPILLNLGIAAAGRTGDTNTLSSVTIGGIPVGATLSNTNRDTLTAVGGSVSLSATQIAAGALAGLSITLPSATAVNLTLSTTEVDAQGNSSAAATGTESVTATAGATVSWSAPAGPGVEGSAIALGALTPSSGNPLTSVLVSGIPVGAQLSDGTHSFTATTGTTSVNALGWNYAALKITPIGDANFSLSAQVTDNRGNVSGPVTEAVTVGPLAPTVTPVTVSGTTGQPILLNLGIAAAGQTGDTNTLSSVTIGSIPAGATLSNTNHDTLTSVNGSITLAAAQLSSGVLNGLSITTSSAGTFNLSLSATERDAEGNTSMSTSSLEAITSNSAATNDVPAYSHIVVVIEENKDADQIIGDTTDAPYLNFLASNGADLTNYYAITHPSQPNYFALYSGSTFGTADDLQHSEPDPTLATVLQGAGKSFTGYVEGPVTDFNHNPWEVVPGRDKCRERLFQLPDQQLRQSPHRFVRDPGPQRRHA